MFCSNCGSKLGQASKFCPKCGAPVSNSSNDGAAYSRNQNTSPYYEENERAQPFWQGESLGLMQPACMSTLSTMEMIDGIVWAIISGIQILNGLFTIWMVSTIESAFAISGMVGLWGGGWVNGLLYLLIGGINAYYSYKIFIFRNALRWNTPLSVIAYYEGQFSQILIMLIYGSTAQLLRQALSNHPSGRKP